MFKFYNLLMKIGWTNNFFFLDVLTFDPQLIPGAKVESTVKQVQKSKCHLKDIRVFCARKCRRG